MGRSKGKAGIKLKCISGNLCTKIVDKPMYKRCFLFNPQCNVTGVASGFIYCHSLGKIYGWKYS